jgi:hypothetical protein
MKDGVEHSGWNIFVTQKHMIELVRIFLANVAKRDARHARRQIGVQSRHR